MKPYNLQQISSIVNLWSTLTHLRLEPYSILEQNDRERIYKILEAVRDNLNYLDLTQTAKYISNIREKIDSGECRKFEQYVDLAAFLTELARNEAEGIIFGFLPRSHGAYFQKDTLFGDAVYEAFPTARADIKEAGTCFAHGTYTACVFHLMRVLELALHKLAEDLGVVFPTTIELENWQNILEKIEKAIREREKQLPKGTQKSEEMQYYSEAAKEFRYFKDAWRNHVSHSRVDYEIHDATKIMEHVCDFMQHLASKE